MELSVCLFCFLTKNCRGTSQELEKTFADQTSKQKKALLQLEANPPLAHAPATLTQRSANCAPLQTAFQYLVANSLAHVFTNTCTHVRTLPYVYPKRLFVYLLLPHTSRIFPGGPHANSAFINLSWRSPHSLGVPRRQKFVGMPENGCGKIRALYPSATLGKWFKQILMYTEQDAFPPRARRFSWEIVLLSSTREFG